MSYRANSQKEKTAQSQRGIRHPTLYGDITRKMAQIAKGEHRIILLGGYDLHQPPTPPPLS